MHTNIHNYKVAQERENKTLPKLLETKNLTFFCQEFTYRDQTL